MEWNKYFKSVLKGLGYALMATFIITAILSLVMSNFTLPSGVFNVVYVVISCFALLLGTVVAVKAHGSKGWMVGLSVGCIFYISLYVIGIMFGADRSLTGYDFIKFSLCTLIGLFSGMLGINL